MPTIRLLLLITFMGGPPLLKLDAPLENAAQVPRSFNYTTDQDVWHEEPQRGRPLPGWGSGNLPAISDCRAISDPIAVFVKLVDASSPTAGFTEKRSLELGKREGT
jgi:hypothetical protein